MGIRYYAYAFDASVTEQVLVAPQLAISRDPLADAWGLPHGWGSGEMQGQLLSKNEMLYLDKAWSLLQRVTRPEPGAPARPAYRMFEGHVTFNDDFSHDAWVRAIAPDEVDDLARDLETITDADVAVALSDSDVFDHGEGADVDFATEYLHAAQRFASAIARTGRGFVYTIG